MEDFDPIKYIDHKCHDTPGDSTSGEYKIETHIFETSSSKKWITFVDLVQKSLV